MALDELDASLDPVIATTLTTTVLRASGRFLENRVTHLFEIRSNVRVNMRLSDISHADFAATMNRNPLEEKLIETARSWINKCHDSHVACADHNSNGAMPTRLLEIHDEDVRLVSGGAIAKTHYAALSYCWGGDQKVKFTSQSMTALAAGIPLESLSPTIRQAACLCLKLGVKLLWVDAFCILQDDGGQDWDLEASKVQQIYGNAHFTLAVCSAASASHGFMNVRWPSDLSINPKRADIAGMFPIPELHTLSDVRAFSPLGERGWIFQEELLSPRILYWSDQGIFWSCSTAVYTEQSTTETTRGRVPMQETSREGLDPHDFRRTGDPILLWDDMISNFSIRKFTIDEDRLPAVSGLASLIQKATGEDYLLGLWKSRLPSQLLWVVTDPPNMTNTKGVDVAHVPRSQPPSWSWASIKSARQILMPKQASSRAVFLHTGPESPTRQIRLRGRARRLTKDLGFLPEWPEEFQTEYGHARFPALENQGACWSINELEHTILISLDWRRPILIRLDSKLPSVFEELICFEINYLGFLLLEASSSDDTSLYRRIGCSQPHREPSFFDGAPQMTIMIE